MCIISVSKIDRSNIEHGMAMVKNAVNGRLNLEEVNKKKRFSTHID
jgi:hypothetical protein